MQEEVIEFELECSEHGRHRILTPAALPRPRHCAHCHLPLLKREEIRRFRIAPPVERHSNSEAFIG